jgi:hypothetical protein
VSFRSLVADLLLGGNLSNAYTLGGTITAGTPGGLSVVVDGARLAIFYYDANGHLVLSLSPDAGTDSHGTSYPAGLGIFNAGTLLGVWDGIAWTVGETGQGQIQAVVSSLIPVLGFLTPNPNIINPTNLSATQLNQGTNAAFDEFDLMSAQDGTNQETWSLTMRSASKDASARAQILIRLLNLGSTFNAALFDFAGGHLVGDLTAVHPGTGTATVNAVAETWQAPALTANFRSDTISHPLRFRKDGLGPNGIVRLDGGVQANGAGPWPSGIDICTLPVGYRPLAGTRSYITKSSVLASAGAGTVRVLNTGEVQLDVTFTSNTQQVFFDGVTFPLD